MRLHAQAKHPHPGISNERLEHQRLTSLINSMADAVVAVDEVGKIVLYNAALLNILDVNNIARGSSLSELFRPLKRDDQPADVMAMIERAKTPITSRDLRLAYSDGSLINLYISIAPVRLGYGEKGQHGYVLLLRDITREKSLEEERDEFISVVSHELRTPIAIAEGNISNAQFIADKGANLTAVKQALNEAHSQVVFLAAMMNDLSTLSRAERGTLKVEVEPIDVMQLVNKLVNDYQTEVSTKGLELQAVLAPGLPVLHSSQLYVREILQNFVTNAIKYSHEGRITLTATPLADGGVCFAVSDSGIGISKSDQELVFNKFFRSEDYRTRQAKGTGLGLYVTTKLARLLKAKIELESELNKGSTFMISVPDLQ